MRAATLAWSLCAVLSVLHAAPAPDPAPAPDASPAADPAPTGDNTPEIIEIIAPAASAQETLSTLNLGAAGPGAELSERNKRTIGILRQLFPTLTQTIEQKIQQFSGMLVQAFGPIVLRTILGRGGGGGATGGGSGTVDLDDDDDDDDETTSTQPPVAEAEKATRRRRSLRGAAAADEQQLLSGAESQQAEVRVAFGEGAAAGAGAEDQQAAAQTNSASIDEISLDDSDSSEENRNKRFLNFGLGGGASAGGGGGSGNFIFDIVRRPAEAMARAAGTAFRLFAGTDSLNVGLTASHSATRDLSADGQLVAGSSSGSAGVGVEAGVEAGADGEAKGDGLTEGVPGPITRLFIIANRGIANLIQDLILRLAQTSERIVNFKARLITSII